MATTSYTTREGQRWDTIAYEVYDNPYLYSPIIEANPQYRNVVVFAQSVTLQIPLQEEVTPVVINSSLPPWRR